MTDRANYCDCADSRPAPLAVGDIIHSLDGEVFGNDHYACLLIEAVGPDWIVARDPHRSSWPLFAYGRDNLARCQQARDEACTSYSYCPDTEPPLTTWSLR